jgi:hypothetical protein
MLRLSAMLPQVFHKRLHRIRTFALGHMHRTAQQ